MVEECGHILLIECLWTLRYIIMFAGALLAVPYFNDRQWKVNKSELFDDKLMFIDNYVYRSKSTSIKTTINVSEHWHPLVPMFPDSCLSYSIYIIILVLYALMACIVDLSSFSDEYWMWWDFIFGYDSISYSINQEFSQIDSKRPFVQQIEQFIIKKINYSVHFIIIKNWQYNYSRFMSKFPWDI